MRTSVYQAISLTSLAGSILATVAMWRWANAVYRIDQSKGWLIGASSLGIPVLVLTLCWLWIRRDRKLGNPNAKVGWLPWVLGLSAFLWGSMVVFSLL